MPRKSELNDCKIILLLLYLKRISSKDRSWKGVSKNSIMGRVIYRVLIGFIALLASECISVAGWSLGRRTIVCMCGGGRKDVKCCLLSCEQNIYGLSQAGVRVMDAKRMCCQKGTHFFFAAWDSFFLPKDCYANLGDLQTAAKLRFKRNVSTANDWCYKDILKLFLLI